MRTTRGLVTLEEVVEPELEATQELVQPVQLVQHLPRVVEQV